MDTHQLLYRSQWTQRSQRWPQLGMAVRQQALSRVCRAPVTPEGERLRSDFLKMASVFPHWVWIARTWLASVLLVWEKIRLTTITQQRIRTEDLTNGWTQCCPCCQGYVEEAETLEMVWVFWNLRVTPTETPLPTSPHLLTLPKQVPEDHVFKYLSLWESSSLEPPQWLSPQLLPWYQRSCILPTQDQQCVLSLEDPLTFCVSMGASLCGCACMQTEVHLGHSSGVFHL